MSVYSDAIEKLGVEVGSFVEGWIGAFLRYLPPSIVVDGRVVELKDAHRILASGYVSDYGSPNENADELADDWTIQLLQAAREVAEGRERR